MENLRKVIVAHSVKEKTSNNYIRVRSNGLFHGWGYNVLELKDSATQYSQAIIELEDGKVISVFPEDIQFVAYTTVNDNVDELLSQLRGLTHQTLFVEYYPHEDCQCYKILNEYTLYAQEKVVVGRVDEGYVKALQEAIKYLTNSKSLFKI